MKTGKKLLGFVILIAAVLIGLQLMTMFAKQGGVSVGPGVEFKPGEIAKHAPPVEDGKASDAPPVQTELPMPEKSPPVTSQSPPPLPEDTQPVESTPKTDEPDKSEDQQADAGPAKSPDDNQGNRKPETYEEKRKINTVSLSDEEFIALDQSRDEMKKKAEAYRKKTEGTYGWGLVGSEQEPDQTVQTLGGTPFAIDREGKYFYRISLKEDKVKAATMVDAAYSTTGIEAYDQRLRNMIRRAIAEGHVTTPPEQLTYCYLLTIDTERYLIEKVVNAFEWYIQNAGYEPEKSDHFRQNARVRLDVWKAMRAGGGEMGVAVPIYFDYEGVKIFLPEDYYQQDSEAARLKIQINRDLY